MAIIKNLGWASVVSEGLSSPSNTKLLWFNTNVGEFRFYYYDIGTLNWELLGSGAESTWKGIWVTATSYTVGQYVIEDNKIYICDVDNSDVTFTPANWTLALDGDAGGGGSSTWKGVWVTATPYLVGEYVVENNNIYLCATANSDVAFTPANWTLVLEGGSTTGVNSVYGYLDPVNGDDASAELGNPFKQYKTPSAIITDIPNQGYVYVSGFVSVDVNISGKAINFVGAGTGSLTAISAINIDSASNVLLTGIDVFGNIDLDTNSHISVINGDINTVSTSDDLSTLTISKANVTGVYAGLRKAELSTFNVGGSTQQGVALDVKNNTYLAGLTVKSNCGGHIYGNLFKTSAITPISWEKGVTNAQVGANIDIYDNVGLGTSAQFILESGAGTFAMNARLWSNKYEQVALQTTTTNNITRDELNHKFGTVSVVTDSLRFFANTDSTVSNSVVIYGNPELLSGSEKFFTSKVASITYEVSSDGGDTYTSIGNFTALASWFNTTPTTTSITFVRSIFVFIAGVIGEQSNVFEIIK